ncbi:histidine kinase, partial [Pyxidicoccus sp. 3LG]
PPPTPARPTHPVEWLSDKRNRGRLTVRWSVKQVGEAHSGSAALASRPGSGATFTRMLPCD